MSTVPAGLASLTQAVSDLTAEVTATVTQLATLSAQLTALNSEDPAVQNLAQEFLVKHFTPKLPNYGTPKP